MSWNASSKQSVEVVESTLRPIDKKLLQQLVDASHILYIEGQNDLNHGQISARIPGESEFWLRGGALGFDEIVQNDFLRIGPHGEVISGRRHRPPEWPIHTEIYQARPEVNAIVHTHAPNAIIFGALGQVLLPLSHDGCPFHGRLNIFDVTTNTILTVETAQAMVQALVDNCAVLLKNHGIVVVGRSVKEAAMLTLMLERACAMQLRVPFGQIASGSPDNDVMDKNKFIYSDIAVMTYWNYCIRKLSRIRANSQLYENRFF